MIFRSHVIAPSKNALRYLRQVLSRWPCELRLSHCTRFGNTRRESHCARGRVHSSPDTLGGRRSPLSDAATVPVEPKRVSRYIPPNFRSRSGGPSVGHASTPATGSRAKEDNATPVPSGPKRVFRYPSNRKSRGEGPSAGHTSTSATGPQVKEDNVSSKVWALQCCRLALERKLLEATQKFLKGLDRGEHGVHVKTTGKVLMKALAAKGRYLEIPQIFHRMAVSGEHSVDTYSLNMCLEAHLYTGMHWRFKATWEHHKPRLKPNHRTFMFILLNLVVMRKLNKAEKLVRVLLRKKSLPLVHPSAFAVLLGGIRIVSGSFMKMERVYKWMENSRVVPHVTVFNILIETAISIGRLDIARGYALEKLVRGIKHDVNTFGIFLAAHLRAGNWAGTSDILRRMQAENIKPTTPIFNMLLKGFSSGLEFEALGKFFDIMVAQGVSPDSTSYNIMIHMCAKRWDEASIELWVCRMKDAGIEPDAVTVNTLFHVIRMTGGAIPSMLRRIYNAISDWDRSLVNTRTKDMLMHSVYKGAERIRIRPFFAHVDQTGEEIAMEAAIQGGRPGNAINIFRKVLSKGVKPSIPLVSFAVRATLSLPPGQHGDPYRLLRTAQQRGVKISKIPLLNAFEISMPDPSARPPEAYTTVSGQVRRAYEFLEAANLPITHDISVNSACRMINQGHTRAAVLLLHEISKTPWGQGTSWGVGGLTVLMKGYIGVEDLSGVGWIVDQMTQSSEVPDTLFFNYLRLAKRIAKSEEERNYLRRLEVRCLQHGRERREEAKRRAQFLWHLVEDWKKS